MSNLPFGVALRVIHAGETILSERESSEIRDFVIQPASRWFSENERISFDRAFRGDLISTSGDYFFLLVEGKRFVSSAWYAVSRKTPAIAVLGYVFTDPERRGRGYSTYLLQVLWEHFETRGGKMMYLGTANPTARSIYIKNGFRDLNGHVMRRVAENLEATRFAEKYFEPSSRTHIRAGEWGDLAPATCLYAEPFPWTVRDFMENIIYRPAEGLARCVSIYVAVMLRSEITGNSMRVLETEDGRLVGCGSSISVAKGEPVLEFLGHPNYQAQLLPLLENVLEKGRQFKSYAAREDSTKVAILRALGFHKSTEADLGSDIGVFEIRK